MSGQRPNSKKRKSTADGQHYISRDGQDTSRPSAVYRPTKGRGHTVSVALPGSVIANAVTHDQKTALAGHIARACAVFCVDEIVVFDDGHADTRAPERGGYTAFADPSFFLYHVLSYLETPPHLRKALFPMHPDLRTAGALPSLDMPHHMRSEDDCEYREGITTRSAQRKDGAPGMLVECGLRQQVFVPVELEENVRLTVQLPQHARSSAKDMVECNVVAPDAPREQAGYYWGYSVRQASSLSNVFTECPHDGGYDASIGTSERGHPVSSLADRASDRSLEPTWQHLLVVFGGVAGLEVALANDPELQAAGVHDASEVFDYWINLVPGQGSRTIRTEEAVWVGLACLSPLVEARNTNA
ncbi:uncharacterized protein LTR77_009979 [Saxophila tyrrhenica]|uniref:DUF171-domain-containing protein n=1 Tax=Saxophila tyrrhenica TaxID=1690608 RepID=A0AAV9NZ73_9PEZI|nr:hypothetical protein LTR77_009979 [Saxophila tyrrhenica]